MGIDKPLTVEQLRKLLDVAGVDRTGKRLKNDLSELCIRHGLIHRPPVAIEKVKNDETAEGVDAVKRVEKYTVVKCALKRAMNLDEDQFAAFSGGVEEFVGLISRMLRRASLALAHHTAWLFEGDVQRAIPDLFKANDTYWKDWLRIGIDGHYPDDASRESFKLIQGLVGGVYDVDAGATVPKDFDQVLNYAGHALRTAVQNNAWVPLFSRLARLTKHKLVAFGVPTTIKAFDVMKAIRAGEKQQEALSAWPQVVQEYVKDVRTRLNAADPTVILYDEHGQQLPFAVLLRFNHWMLQQFESLQQRRSRLSPVFKVGRAHVRLDLKVLVAICKRTFPQDKAVVALAAVKKSFSANGNVLGCKNPENCMVPKKPKTLRRKKCADEASWLAYKAAVHQHKMEAEVIRASEAYILQKKRYDSYVEAKRDVATSFFRKLPKKQGWTFAGSIMTDGVAVSLQYTKVVEVPVESKQKKRKRAAQPQEPQTSDNTEESELEYDRHLSTLVPGRAMNGGAGKKDVLVAGDDPGRDNLAAVAYIVQGPDGKLRTQSWTLSRGEYYVRSGIKRLNKAQRSRLEANGLLVAWTALQGEGVALSTSRSEEMRAYLAQYATFSAQWWSFALQRRESRANFQRYIGKRKVMDSFYARIKRHAETAFPSAVIEIAYGSAFKSMKPTGVGEVAAPVGAMFKACKRVFGPNVSVVDEVLTTQVDWASGLKKELAYKVLEPDGRGGVVERLRHTANKSPPVITDPTHLAELAKYRERKRVQGSHRRGGRAIDRPHDDQRDDEKKKEEKKRATCYPEIRGLRFCTETRMFLDRDRQSALAIARLRCMEVLGLPRPYPFCHQKRSNKNTSRDIEEPVAAPCDAPWAS